MLHVGSEQRSREGKGDEYVLKIELMGFFLMDWFLIPGGFHQHFSVLYSVLTCVNVCIRACVGRSNI